MRSIDESSTHRTLSVVQEGVRAGAFVAAGVAVVFTALDLRLTGRLFTPELLGAGLGRLLGVRAMTESSAVAVAGYAVFHFAAFIALATAIAAIARRARRDASVLAAALLLFAVTELAFVGLVVLLGETSVTGALARPQLVLGNVLGWLLLGGWTWRAHPELRREFADAVAGAEPAPSH